MGSLTEAISFTREYIPVLYMGIGKVIKSYIIILCGLILVEIYLYPKLTYQYLDGTKYYIDNHSEVGGACLFYDDYPVGIVNIDDLYIMDSCFVVRNTYNEFVIIDKKHFDYKHPYKTKFYALSKCGKIYSNQLKDYKTYNYKRKFSTYSYLFLFFFIMIIIVFSLILKLGYRKWSIETRFP